MAYNNVINRSEAASLIPEEASREILGMIPQQSAVLQMGRRLPDMNRGQLRLPVVSALPTAYFVNGDTGLKQTTEVNWANVFITAEEIACIVPVPEAVLADADYDIWAQVKPLIAEAFGVTIDAAILLGTNKPASWPEGLVPGAEAAGHVVAVGTGAGLFDDLLNVGGVIALVEADGYMVNGHVAHPTLRAMLRGIKDVNGQPLFVRSLQDQTRYELDGAPIAFARNGALNPAAALLVSGDWSQLVYSFRQELTYKVLTEGVIQDGNGVIQYNLAQQDMVALRCVMRVGWQLPNPINRENGDAGTRYPFGVLAPGAAQGAPVMQEAAPKQTRKQTKEESE